MAYRADITQALTPSAPDVSGAVRAIQAQADIANTLFSGISTGLGMYKQQMGEELLAKSEEEQRKALVKDETFIKEQQQAIPELQKAQADLETNRLAEAADMERAGEGEFQKVSAEPAFKAKVEAAASRLALVQANGGMTPSEYFLRIAKLVDEYSAKYPGSRSEVRKIVEQGSGLPGADLWAQQQFINRLYAPLQASVEVDKLASKAREDEYNLVVKYTTNIAPTELQVIQSTKPDTWSQLTKTALEQDALVKNKALLDSQAALNVAATDPQFLQKADLYSRSATLAAGIASAKFLSQNFDQFNDINNKLKSNTFSEQDQAVAQNLFNGMKGAIQAAFAKNTIDVQNAAGPNVSSAALTEMMGRLKAREEATLRLLDTSTQAQTVAAMKMFAEAKNKSIENRVKLTGAWAQLVGMVGEQSTVRAALAAGETDKDGKITPEWEKISNNAPNLVPLLREFQSLVEDSPAQLTRNVTNSSILAQGLQDAASSPAATNLPNATPKERSGVAQGVALWGAEIVAGSRDSKLPAEKAMQIGKSLSEDAKVNIVGTAMSNAPLGHGLNIINQNKEQFRDFISKLPEEKKSAVSFSASESYTKSLESATRGLKLISEDPKYKLKQPLKLGIRPDGVVGIIPPPKEWVEPARGTGRNYMSLPANIRKYYKDPTKYYGGEPMIFKPEFVEEGNRWAKAMEEWENKYLPRVTGAISTRAIIENNDTFKVANEIVKTIQNNKPIEGFYKVENVPTSVAEEAPVESAVSLAGVGEIKNPSLDKLMSLAQLPTTPDDTREKLMLIIQDMMSGVATDQSEKKKITDYGNRPDGSKKGTGFLGELKLPSGDIATEYSVQSDAVKVKGKRVDFPTLVPTLTKEEVALMVNDIIPNDKEPPESIMQKAIKHANDRIKAGKSVFAAP